MRIVDVIVLSRLLQCALEFQHNPVAFQFKVFLLVELVVGRNSGACSLGTPAHLLKNTKFQHLRSEISPVERNPENRLVNPLEVRHCEDFR